MSVLSRAMNATRVAALEKEILEALRKSDRVCAAEGRRNVGVDVPAKGDLAPLYAAALSRILARNPELVVVRFENAMTLSHRNHFRLGMEQQSFDALESTGRITNKL